MHAEFKEHAEFLLVYIREAHASDEWVMPDNEMSGISFPQPTTLDERRVAANACVADFELGMTTVLDRMDDPVSDVYGAWPDRLYVIDAEGRVAYQGGVGPFGFKPDEVAAFLREHLPDATAKGDGQPNSAP